MKADTEQPAEATLVDSPRIGFLMWMLLLAMFSVPAALVWLGNNGLDIPHLRVWVAVLGAPPFVLLLLLPRRYRLDGQELVIEGLFYRRRIARADILAVTRESLLGALVRPGSVFCTDPARALKIELKGRQAVVISPQRPEVFLAAGPARENIHEG